MPKSRKAIKKSIRRPVGASGIKQAGSDDKKLTFSFRFFDNTDEEVCPKIFSNGYTQALMERLRDLSSWKVSEFRGSRSKSIRSHPIDWKDTARPDGFTNLNEQFDAYEPWQFSVSTNAHGRVHGLIINGCFHIIWLDADHNVYS